MPSCWIWSRVSCRAPSPMETIAITVATPKIMPSIVSRERSLWLHSSRKPVLTGAVMVAKFTSSWPSCDGSGLGGGLGLGASAGLTLRGQVIEGEAFAFPQAGGDLGVVAVAGAHGHGHRKEAKAVPANTMDCRSWWKIQLVGTTITLGRRSDTRVTSACIPGRSIILPVGGKSMVTGKVAEEETPCHPSMGGRRAVWPMELTFPLSTTPGRARSPPPRAVPCGRR